MLLMQGSRDSHGECRPALPPARPPPVEALPLRAVELGGRSAVDGRPELAAAPSGPNAVRRCLAAHPLDLFRIGSTCTLRAVTGRVVRFEIGLDVTGQPRVFTDLREL